MINETKQNIRSECGLPKYRNINHPGVYLKEEYIPESNLDIDDIATYCPSIKDIISGKVDITADIALQLSKLFGPSPVFWLNLQRDYDLCIRIDNLNVDWYNNIPYVYGEK